MSVGIDKLASELQKVREEKDKNKKTPYDTEAEVVRVDTEVVWVKIPGGVDETPAQKTVNAKVGDIVQVRVSGGRAFLVGNGTNPPTDDKLATEAKNDAEIANNNALTAGLLAQSAEKSAQTAREAASSAQTDASVAHDMAQSARASADSATASASLAFNQLSIVEDIVGVIELISNNGRYELSGDVEVVSNKWYFTRSGEGTDANPYVYAIVNNPSGSPQENGWYELVDVQESIRNYVSSHIAVDDNGLWLQTDGTSSKVLISATDGVVMYGPNGKIISRYGETAQIGDPDGFHMTMDGAELGFYQANQRVAYIRNNQLYITQSVVLQQMDLGVSVSNGGLGLWSWKVHPNGMTPSRNNLNLKWMG